MKRLDPSRLLRSICWGCSLLALSWTLFAAATETSPWFGNTLEFQFEPSAGIDSYSKLSAAQGNVKRSDDVAFLNLSLSSSLLDEWRGEVELFSADTCNRDFNPAHLRATLSHLWLNDIIGEPLSVATGLSLTIPLSKAIKDVSLGYRGSIEAELFVSFGRERSDCVETVGRWWAVGAIGAASSSSMWVKGDFNVEHSFCYEQTVGLFARGLWGFGNDRLDLTLPFQGYGSIDYKSVDLGLGYRWEWPCYALFKAEYSVRAFAHNFPKNNQRFTVSVVIPFSL